MTILRMFGLLLPILVFILAIIYFVISEYSTEGFENKADKISEENLKKIEMKINATISTKDKERIDKMFKAYWNMTKQSSKEIIVNPVVSDSVPAWVETNEDAITVMPHLIRYSLGEQAEIPDTKTKAIVEGFKNFTDNTKLSEVDDMTQEQVEQSMKKNKTKQMSPKEAEKQAYSMMKSLANTKFDKNFHDALGFVIGTVVQKAQPKAKPEIIREETQKLVSQLPAVLENVQMDTRALLRKVDAAKQKQGKSRRNMTLKQFQKKDNPFKLDREAYINSLPEHTRIMMEHYTQENFFIKGILRSILKPIIEFAMGIIRPVIMGSVGVFLQLIPFIMDSVAIPVIKLTMDVIMKVLTSKSLLNAVINVIKKVVLLIRRIGWELIRILSMPVLIVFFQTIVPIGMTIARFFIFMFRMGVRLARTVFNYVRSLIMANWSYLVLVYNYAISTIKWLWNQVKDFLEPYIAYMMYIIIPICVMIFMWHLGPPLLEMVNRMLAMSMTAVPERTFHPVKVATDNAQ